MTPCGKPGVAQRQNASSEQVVYGETDVLGLRKRERDGAVFTQRVRMNAGDGNRTWYGGFLLFFGTIPISIVTLPLQLPLPHSKGFDIDTVIHHCWL